MRTGGQVLNALTEWGASTAAPFNFMGVGIERARAAHEAREGDVTFAVDEQRFVAAQRASLIITTPGLEHLIDDRGPVLQGFAFTEHPKAAMAHVIRKFFPEAPLVGVRGAHPTAVVGAAGQGFYIDVDGTRRPFPQVGSVRIGPGATIGPCSTIMRGALDDTVIGADTSIGNGVNVGHGAKIGKRCLIAAHATIGGSAVIGDDVTIWMGAMIANGVRVWEGAEIGMGAVVLRNVPAHSRAIGVPAKWRFTDGAGI